MSYDLTQADFAKLRGVSQPMVSKWIKTGKIKSGVQKINGRYRIDGKKANKELEKNLDPIRSKPKTSTKAMVAKAKSAGTVGLSFNEARTLNEQYKAATNKLNYEALIKKYILAATVKKEAFECARKTRDQLMAIPDRMDSVLAAETDPHKIHEVLTKEIKQALEAVIGELSKK